MQYTILRIHQILRLRCKLTSVIVTSVIATNTKDKLMINLPFKRDSRSYQCVWSGLLVGCLAFACYVNSSWGEFVFDDSEAILGNKDVNPNTSLFQVFKNDFWGTRISSNSSHKSYRPFTVVTFQLNYWLVGGLEPFGFHAVNVALHVVVSLLYFKACNTVCDHALLVKNCMYKNLTPTVAALLFAVHPIHSESVAGIVGRAELTSAICFFLTWFCYIRACRCDSAWWIMVWWLVLTVLLATCALLFKEQGITVMGVCIVYDIILNIKGDPSDLFKLKFSPYKDINLLKLTTRIVVALVVTLVMLMARLSTGSPTFKPVDNAASFADSLITRVLSYNYIYALNAWLLLTPWWLCFDWSMGCIPLLSSFMDPRIIAVAVFWIILGILVSYCLLAEKGPLKRLVTMSLAMTVITFLPASNVFLHVGFVIAERVLYLPSTGYCLLVALGIVTLIKHFNKLIWCGFIFVITLFTIRSVLRSSQWMTEEDLFVSGITVCPLNAKVFYNIGKVKSDSGDVVTGLAAYKEAIRLNPEYDQALNNLGNLLKEQGELIEAEQLFNRAIEINQNFPAAWMNLGIVQAALGQMEEAEKSYKTAINYRKKYPDAYYNLGNLYIDAGRYDDAIAAYESAITLKRDHINAWNNIGLLYENLKRYDKSEEVLRKAIAEVPNCAQFYSSLGILLGRQNKLKEGKRMLEKAVTLNPNSGNFHANLGVIYHLNKEYERAEDSYVLALKLEPDLALAKENFKKLMSVKKKQ